MSKKCSSCGADNDDDSMFCRNCGKKLSGIHPVKNDNVKKKNNEKILIATVVVLLIAIAIIGTYAFVTLNNDNDSDVPVVNVSNNSGSNDSNTNTNSKSWHKIGTYNGVSDDTIMVTSNGNKIKVVPSAMPLKNYADNYLYTTVTQNGNTVGSSDLSWGSSSAVATKSDSIEFSGSGTYYIYISAYELQYWDLEVYEYY